MSRSPAQRHQDGIGWTLMQRRLREQRRMNSYRYDHSKGQEKKDGNLGFLPCMAIGASIGTLAGGPVGGVIGFIIGGFFGDL